MSPRKRTPHPAGRPQAPPPVMGDPLSEAWVVLQEVAEPQGIVLWRLVQDVVLWLRAPEEGRPDAFRGQVVRKLAPCDFGLNAPVAGLDEELRGREPGGVERAASHCMAIAEWARDRGHTGTALLFTLLQALACPRDATVAHRVGMLARVRSDFRAEVWYRRAVVLGRRGRDWKAYARSLDGLGMLYRDRGDPATAERFYMRALKAARAYRLRGIEANALQNLCMVFAEQGQAERSAAYGREAFDAYGPNHPRLYALVNDIAVIWMTVERAYERALFVFQHVLRHTMDPKDRLYALANITHAAGGAGQRDVFASAWAELWEQLSALPRGNGHASALLDAAQGALLLGLAEDAERAAIAAATAAERLGETRFRLQAEAFLDALRQGGQGGAGPPPPKPTTASDAFAVELVSALRKPPHG